MVRIWSANERFQELEINRLYVMGRNSVPKIDVRLFSKYYTKFQCLKTSLNIRNTHKYTHVDIFFPIISLQPGL